MNSRIVYAGLDFVRASYMEYHNLAPVWRESDGDSLTESAIVHLCDGSSPRSPPSAGSPDLPGGGPPRQAQADHEGIPISDGQAGDHIHAEQPDQLFHEGGRRHDA